MCFFNRKMALLNNDDLYLVDEYYGVDEYDDAFAETPIQSDQLDDDGFDEDFDVVLTIFTLFFCWFIGIDCLWIRFYCIYLYKGVRKTDTSAFEARNGKDIQGIPWERMNFSRDRYRDSRLKLYKNYESVAHSRDGLQKVYTNIHFCFE